MRVARRLERKKDLFTFLKSSKIAISTVSFLSVVAFIIAPYAHAVAGPTLSSISANSGSTAGGTNVTLNGSSFSIAGKKVTAISAGTLHNLALASDGTVYAWGKNSNTGISGGALGNGTTTDSSVPVAVTTAGTPMAGKTIVAISGGEFHSLALASDGTVYAWGDNTYGELGNNSTTGSLVPVAVTTAGTPMAGKTIVAISAGRYYSTALASDGTVYAWGSNLFGELGNGTTSNNPGSVPVAVTTAGTPMAGKTITAISGNGFRSTSLALASDGTVYAWGSNLFGELGNNSTTNSSVPVAVTTAGTPMAGKTITAIAGNTSYSLALASDGTVYAWGYNSDGELGNNSTTNSSVPVAVTTAGTPMAGKTITAISAGSAEDYALASDGTVYAWGDNTYGELGNNSTTGSLVPVAVTTAGTPMAGKTITAIASGGFFTIALANDGTVYAWGYNGYGELGNGTTVNSILPVAVLPGALTQPLTVTFGGVAATNINFVSSTQITATTPAHALGAVDIVVTNGDGQTSTLSNGFTYSTVPGAPNTSAFFTQLTPIWPVVLLGLASAMLLIRMAWKRQQRPVMATRKNK